MGKPQVSLLVLTCNNRDHYFPWAEEGGGREEAGTWGQGAVREGQPAGRGPWVKT